MKVQQEIESFKDLIYEVKDINFTHSAQVDNINVEFDTLPDFIIWSPTKIGLFRNLGGSLAIKAEPQYFIILPYTSGNYAIINSAAIINQTDIRFSFTIYGPNLGTEIESRAYCFYKRDVHTSASS